MPAQPVGHASSAELGLASKDQARLQVIICYGQVLSNHVALRLVGPGAQVLFWDPGGYFALKDSAAKRRHDVIVAKPPSLDQWWQYRLSSYEPFMLAFEWDLSPQTATQMRDVLLHGTPRTDPRGAFHSDYPGMMCCLAVCEFLNRFGPPNMTIPRRWLMPHDLGRHLWTQDPDRVHLFQKDQSRKLLVPHINPQPMTLASP